MIAAVAARAGHAHRRAPAGATGACAGFPTAAMDPSTPLEEERPSKTQRKRDMHDLQALGERLVALNPAQLKRVPVPERLLEAIELARRLSRREARRRQLQFIGRLMRDVDPEPIRAALAVVGGESRASAELMHRCEHLRDRLLEDDGALTGFLQAHPGADPQWLRAKIRAAREEREHGRPPAHARELYRWLHEALLREAFP
jgi:ribosome-associated protein